MPHGKLIPELDHRGTKVLNLTVLQRIDPFIDEILLTVSHSRRDVEGSLFVIKRNSQPRFQFLVMNRRNTENLAEDILGDFEYDVQPPYLLYRNVAQEINGIWFYNSEESETVANLFSRIASAFSKQPLKPTPSAGTSEFKELEAVPGLAVIERPLEPLTSSAAPRDLISNLFSAAKLVGSESSSAVSGKQHQTFEPPSSIDQSISLCLSLLPTLQQATRSPSTFSPLMPYVNSKESSSSPLIRPLFTPSSSSSSLLPQLISSSSSVAPPVYPPGTMQHPYGTPLFQPFPSLAQTSSLGSVITKEQIHNAFLKLVQNDQFIEMVYQELRNAHDT
ncbi:mRNA-decapping enzyme-like protein isoform X2 [Dioscorea cayenensis subsp. rotundata]|uniref:mRNA-decapping enzyme-like protein isoform X2 n=1 Tax=Dioscorea cayennensis subsp. rotundata TaxID=55577 RepID=A0AB40C2U5_DIOCR|nr:mRNA-decapping enzyme-like protein isoform X2 [Dioscorea cayenensis subsp. rotundata]